MLLRFRFSNFRSFRDEQVLTLIGNTQAKGRGGIQVEDSKDYVLPICAIYGSNASGKSNLLKALRFVKKAVLSSHRQWEPDGPIPLQTFGLGSVRTEAEFAVDFLVNGVRHQFGFSANSDEITSEWLFTYPAGKRTTAYTRAAGVGMKFGRTLQGDNKATAALMRKNSLFLSTAAQNNHEALMPVYRWFQDKISFASGNASVPFTTLKLCADEGHRQQIAAFMAFADLGITDLAIEKKSKESAERMARAFNAMARELEVTLPLPDFTLPDTVSMTHQIGDTTVSFDSEEESDGTQAYLALVGPIIAVLEGGGVLVVDEIDSSLHPDLTAFLIRLFASATSNPRGSQLVFTTHDTTLLDSSAAEESALIRDEIWLVQKDRFGASSIYPLSDFKSIKGENIRRFYLNGRFGGIPFINSERIVERLLSHE